MANSAVDFYRGLNMRLRNTIEQESNVLDEMQDLVSPRSSPQRTLGEVPATFNWIITS